MKTKSYSSRAYHKELSRLKALGQDHDVAKQGAKAAAQEAAKRWSILEKYRQTVS